MNNCHTCMTDEAEHSNYANKKHCQKWITERKTNKNAVRIKNELYTQ